LYEFGALSFEKSNQLLQLLKQDYTTTCQMTLPEIYNHTLTKNTRKAIGFVAYNKIVICNIVNH